MSRVATPFHCPFCAEQDLFPTDPEGAWHCRACTRVFIVTVPSPEGPGTASSSGDAAVAGRT